MLSKSCQYAIRAIIYIARYGHINKKVELKEMAEKLNIPAPFLAKVMQQLTKRHLVNSVKGPNGGFYLTDREKKKSLLDIMEAIDGLEYFKLCGLGMDECSAVNPCPLHSTIIKFNESMRRNLQLSTIKKLEKQLDNREFFIIR
ncbi:MAG: RrF2 family transcriptional regulator [Bacteroidia bacterium]